MERILFSSLITLLSFVQMAQGQSYPCGTAPERSEWLQEFQAAPQAYPKSDETIYVGVAIHIVGNEQGNGFFELNNLFDAFCELNQDFEQVNMQFAWDGQINYITSNEYYKHDFDAGTEMMAENNLPNIINCYIVEDPAETCGYSSRSGIALRKECLAPGDHTWAHELGHHLSLPHTFFGWEAEENLTFTKAAPPTIGGRVVEKVDRTNCSYAGDGFCDTSPDYLNFRWNCNGKGESRLTQKDPNGEDFNSDGTLIMSYSNNACATRFSDDQILAMRSYVQRRRPAWLREPGEALGPLSWNSSYNDFIEPDRGAKVKKGDNIILSWEALPNASAYLLQVSEAPNFSITFVEKILTDTQWQLVEELPANQEYYWRVKALNYDEYCAPFTSTFGFQVIETGITTSTNGVLDLKNSFQVYPNPVSANQSLQMKIQLERPGSLQFQWMNTNGQVVRSGQIAGTPGEQVFSISEIPKVAGLYFLRLVTEDRQWVARIAVQ